MESDSSQFHLIETAVTDVDGIRAGLANVWEESFAGDDGEPRRGVRGTICFMQEGSSSDFDVRVGLGDEFDLENRRYRVVEINEGEPRGSLRLERKPPVDRAGTRKVQAMAESRARGRFSWIDAALPLPFLVLPYIASSADARAGLSVVCLVAWLLVIRPSWRGLQGLYGTGLLLLQASVWIASALAGRFFS